MRIGVVAYINPAEFKEYFDKGTPLPNINRGASAVNTITLGFLKAGEKVVVISTYPEKGPTLHFEGKDISIHLISTYHPFPKAYVLEKYYMVGRIKRELGLHLDEIDVIHTHWAYDFAYACCSFTNMKPVFCTIRDWAPIIRNYEKGHRKLMWMMIQEQLFKRVLKHKEVNFIANSHYIEDLIHIHYPQNKCVVIQNPIKERYVLSSRSFYPKEPVLVSISQDLMDKRKNYTRLLYAFKNFRKEHPDATLYLIGSYNSYHPIYKCWEKEMLLQNVKLLGFIDHEKLIELLDKASVLIHPSLEESFGNTLLEGIARRIPVIGGEKSGAVPYVLGHGKYGILCNVEDTKDIQDAMEKAIRTEENMSTINAASKYILENLNENVISQRHIILFEEKLRYYSK